MSSGAKEGGEGEPCAVSSPCPGRVAAASRAPDPPFPGPHRRPHSAAGSGARGERAALARVPAPLPPPSLSARPCAARVPRAAWSQTQAGQRGRHCRGGAVGDQEPRGRGSAARTADAGHLRTQVSGCGAGRTRAGWAGGWGRCGAGARGEGKPASELEKDRGREREKEMEAALERRIIGRGPGRQ